MIKATRIRREMSRRKKVMFLDVLAKTGKVMDSAIAVGYTDSSAVQKFRRDDEVFAEAWEVAVTSACDLFEAEAIRRATQGVMEPVYYKGKVVGHKLVYSDQLLTLLLRGGNPEKYNQQGGGTNINVKFGVAVLPMPAASEADWEAKAISMHSNQEVISLPDEEDGNAAPVPLSLKRGN